MSLVDISPDELLELAEYAEDEAYKLPAGRRRNRMLTMASNMRAYANRAQWDDSIVIKAEVIPTPTPKPVLN